MNDDLGQGSTDSDLTTGDSTELLSTVTEDNETPPPYDIMDDCADPDLPPNQELQPARLLVPPQLFQPLQPFQRLPNLHVAISWALMTTAIRDQHDYMQLIANTQRRKEHFWRMLTPNGLAFRQQGLLTQNGEPQRSPQSRSSPPRLQVCRSLIRPIVPCAMLMFLFAVDPTSLDMVIALIRYLRDNIIWNIKVEQCTPT